MGDTQTGVASGKRSFRWAPKDSERLARLRRSCATAGLQRSIRCPAALQEVVRSNRTGAARSAGTIDVETQMSGVSRQLAYLTIPFWGFDHKRHTGEMIVNASVAEDITEVFRDITRPASDRRDARRDARRNSGRGPEPDRRHQRDVVVRCRKATELGSDWSSTPTGWRSTSIRSTTLYLRGSS